MTVEQLLGALAAVDAKVAEVVEAERGKLAEERAPIVERGELLAELAKLQPLG